MPASAKKASGPSSGTPAGSLSLPVLPSDRTCTTHEVKPSKNATRRAIVLILVHLFIVAHVIQWLITGMTLSPVEPSESMETLREGAVNTGFVFFVAALVSTLIFGRFFCGWACHVVALQDLSSHIMKKFRFRPKPWRTRLLVFMPVFLGLYMFVWPVFHRDVLTPYYPTVAGWFGLSKDMPIWMGRSAPLHGFSTAFVVNDFWATFPPWYIAVPFLIACSLGCVYFLGAKGFCTYACPYGGFFGPIDRVSIGRIVVNDNCEQCGHCTAVCTSNVRVHEEVHEYGAVVNPGCMKCLDCVSVCPKNALSFSFAKPAVLTKAKNTELRKQRRQRRSHLYDLSMTEELVFGAMFFAYLFAFRGMFNLVPLLMAGGTSAIATFLTWKLWQAARTQNVRLHRWQLRKRGRFTSSGVVFCGIVLLVAMSAVWSGFIKYHRWQFNLIDASLAVPAETVFAAGYTPSNDVQTHATRAIRHASLSAPFADGGIGWAYRGGERVRLAWMYCVNAEFDRAEQLLAQVALHDNADMELVESILHVMRARGASDTERQQMLARVGEANPNLLQLQVLLAQIDARAGKRDAAVQRLRHVLQDPASDISSVGPAAEVLAQLGEVDEVISLLEAKLQSSPKQAEYEFMLGMLYSSKQQIEPALSHFENAAQLAPENPLMLTTLADVLEATGNISRAEMLRKQVRELTIQHNTHEDSNNR
ncbi:MAG: 4Fe-4S binding protein [Phycisphaeraceae bacterium]|nr:4Fe-4S binding protein [Phycisphaerales bacterium]MCB9861607.1 4Fe-4S binding protein [Phycisphaeraceae bacterium]